MGLELRIVFMGSPDFAVPALKLLVSTYSVVGVVTQPDRPAGRGRQLAAPPVKVRAIELGLPVFQPEKMRHPQVLEKLNTWNPDVIIVAAFGQILRQEILDLAPHGCLNVHASLLPRWRGASPIQACILAGDDHTGITIMKLDAGMDTGPTLSMKSIPILPEDTGGSLFDKLANLGGDLLIETLPGYIQGNILPQAQDEKLATYTKILKKEDGLLDFNQSAVTLARKVRAFDPWPGTYLPIESESLKVKCAHPEEGSFQPGHHCIWNGTPAIATAQGLLVLDEVQPSGRRSMTGRAFLSGARDWLDPV